MHKEHLRGVQFGAVTWAYIASALALGVLAPRINQRLFPWLVSPLDVSSISAILSAIASGMITLTGIVFSLIFVIVQFGSSAYSLRITRLYANVRVLRHALGIFTGTFIYSLMALRTTGTEHFVSAFTVWLAFAWLLASVTVLAKLVYVFTSLTIGNVLFSLGKAGADSIARVYMPRAEINTVTRQSRDDIQMTQRVVYEGQPGYVIAYDTASLVSLARATDSVIHLPYSIGEPVQDGEPIALIYGAVSIEETRIHKAITLGRERAFQNDPKYSLRLMVDMAIRALSPAINDPTTAVQSLDHIEMLLHRLGNVQLDIGQVWDGAGKIRVVYDSPSWEDFVRLGLSEIMQYGEASLQVQRRIAALLAYLKQSLPASRIPILERFDEQHRAIVVGAFSNAMLRDWACIGDREGIGGGNGG